MKLSDFDYNLPKELISQSAMKPRDHSRLLILDKKLGKITHKKFYNIIDYLQKGDVLILNNSKVIPARLIGHKKTGGEVEIFLVKKEKLLDHKKKEVWECLVNKKIKVGMIIYFDHELTAKILIQKKGSWLIEFNQSHKKFMNSVDKIGQVPLPPYIKKELTIDDKYDYQTVYADEKKKGSVAAPTAGLHFTKDLLNQIKAKGVHIEYITLHVGLGTFLPVKTENIEKHIMHSEWVEIDKKVIQKIIKAKARKNKIISVGTTSCRSLEALWQKNKLDQDFTEWVDIFIHPPYKFKVVDALITNFHLPKSTLLMLVSALGGKENITKAYQEAIRQKYRFYSYGDAMLII